MQVLKLGLICGGPSPERGISLNSARSVLDHLAGEGIEIHPIYVDQFKQFYSISTAQLYSNTPADFDFKLLQAGVQLSEEALLLHLQSLDMVFPVIHGAFGEDGELQAFLEKNDIPFIASGSKACAAMFHKKAAAERLADAGYATLPSVLLRKGEDNQAAIDGFFNTHQLTRAIVKPVAGGSSIGVFSVDSAELAGGEISGTF